jgi:4'-phosphopantetheinyl transferase
MAPGGVASVPTPDPVTRRLRPGEIHVWRAALEFTGPEGEALGGLLSAAERARALRFHFDRDRRRFIAARGRLRLLLGGYLGVPPEGVDLAERPGGKPCLRASAEDLRFNVSHSGGLALLAFSRGRELGVDLEKEREVPEMGSIAERFFSPAEVAAWRGLPDGERRSAFFRCWTRKEAFLKALGEGLARPLDTFDVTLRPDEVARLLRVEGEPAVAERWHLIDVEVPAGFQAALAVEGPLGPVSSRDWEG